MLRSLKFNKLTAAAVMASGLALMGCLEEPHSSGAEDRAPVSLNLRVGVDGVNTLAKASTISLKKLIVVMTSNVNDTIRDTLTTATTTHIDSVSTSAQTVAKYYSLKPLRSWKVVATIKDKNDSTIHKDSTTTPVLYVGDTATVSLNLSSKFSMYRANFLTIPDSISSATAGTSKQVLHIRRLVMTLDTTNTVRDSTKKYFTGSPALYYDYVRVGSHSVTLSAYGDLGLDTAAAHSILLYQKTQTISVGAGVDSTISMALVWQGPTMGTDSLRVTIGKVGTVTLNGTLPTNVVQ